MWIYDAWAWLLGNWKRVAVGAVAVGLAGGALAITSHQRGQRELAASDALLLLQLKGEGKAKASEFTEVADRFKGTVAAERALMLSATALFTEGRYAEAKSRFNDYLASHSGGQFRPAAMLGIAACEDGAKELDKAVAAYQQVISAYPNDPIAAQARMSLALVLEGRDLKGAYKLYDEVSKMQGTAFSNEARAKLEELVEKHPELKPPATSASQLPIGIAAPPAR
jgi:outer membrane protein assembly factor BamD (BamD/ComL family)